MEKVDKMEEKVKGEEIKEDEVKEDETHTDGEVYLIYLITNLITEVGFYARRSKDTKTANSLYEVLQHYDEKLDSFIFKE